MGVFVCFGFVGVVCWLGFFMVGVGVFFDYFVKGVRLVLVGMYYVCVFLFYLVLNFFVLFFLWKVILIGVFCLVGCLMIVG